MPEAPTSRFETRLGATALVGLWLLMVAVFTDHAHNGGFTDHALCMIHQLGMVTGSFGLLALGALGIIRIVNVKPRTRQPVR